MAFNLNFWKGTSMNQVQYALHYWMNALRPAEEVEALKAEKARELEDAVRPTEERQGDDEKNDASADEPTQALCVPETNPDLYS